MKTTLNTILTAGLALTAGVAFAKEPHGDPYSPIGSLNVNQSMVRSGVKPEVNWNIDYPENVTDVVTVGPRKNLTANKRLRVEIRVVGVAFQSGSTHLPVAFWTRVGGAGAAWQSLFYGKHDEVKPNVPVYDAIVEAGTEIDFAGRGRTKSGSWYSVRWTADTAPTVTGLVNGDYTPDYAPAYDQGDIESFLTPYIGKSNNGHGNNLDGVDMSNPGESTGTAGSVETDASVDDEAKMVTIGPKDMIYLFELYSTNPGSSYFDMQDLAVVVTFHDVD